MEFHRGVLMNIKPERLDRHRRAAALPLRSPLAKGLSRGGGGKRERSAGLGAAQGAERGRPRLGLGLGLGLGLAGEGQRLIGLGRLP